MDTRTARVWNRATYPDKDRGPCDTSTAEICRSPPREYEHARSETKMRNPLAVRDDRSIAKLAKTARSSGFEPDHNYLK